MVDQLDEEGFSSVGQNSDDDGSAISSVTSSKYSFCDGSEFDNRYYSANSVLGTSSVSSSVANHSDLLESYRSLGLGEDLENGARIRFMSPLLSSNSSDYGENDNMKRLSTIGVDIATTSNHENTNGNSSHHEKISEQHDASNRLDVLDDVTTPRCGYSDDDEEILDLGADDVVHIETPGRVRPSRPQNTDLLLMGPSVAFGHDDWDGFVQEIEGDDLMPPPFVPLYGGRPVSWSDIEEKPHDLMETLGSVDDVASAKEALSSVVTTEKTKPIVVSTTLVEKGQDSIEMNEKVAVTGEDSSPLQVDEKLDTNEFFGDMVLEMEDILLNSGESRQTQYAKDGFQDVSQPSLDFRGDRGGCGSSTSTSGNNDIYLPLKQFPVEIQWVEVIGAKQKKGDVSFGERLIGVKEYTVYRLRVWGSCNRKDDHWEVEHRYRDFFSLYRQLKKLFVGHGLKLPTPWSKVNQDSRKFFGNASPNVVSERSSLIQECLQSILSSITPFGMPTSFVWFLTPTAKAGLKTPPPHTLTMGDANLNPKEDFALGKTISLVVEMKFHKSVRQLLEEQRHTCAGCHRHLDSGKTIMQEFVQTLGWGNPRLCEYTGQLFCATCHTNDTAVLPARVLHHWDFSLYPVSQLAKAYLESIHDQPMLCVSAVNPFLFSKVPALRHVMDVRKKIRTMLPYIRCPFWSSIKRRLGSRKYLLESNDFFAVRDLVDLSKGAFSALPVTVDIVSSKILRHITQDCLECYDIGIPCASKEACQDPSSAILPFQEAEAAKCGLCGSIFHKQCITKLKGCPCTSKPAISTQKDKAAALETTVQKPVTYNVDTDDDDDIKLKDNILDSQIQKKKNYGSNVKSSMGFLSDLLSKAKPEKLWNSMNSTNPVILMSSLPSNSL